jgi:hypothetical protein
VIFRCHHGKSAHMLRLNEVSYVSCTETNLHQIDPRDDVRCEPGSSPSCRLPYQKGHGMATHPHREPWNKGVIVGQKAPLKLKEVWAIRMHLQLARRDRELMFNLGVEASCEPATSSSCESGTSAMAIAWPVEQSSCSRRLTDRLVRNHGANAGSSDCLDQGIFATFR